MIGSRVRATLLFLLAICFGVLIFGGYMIRRQKPPIPVSVVSESGENIFTGADISGGQNYYFSRGGQHIGTIWGHGSYLAPDWSADFLHRTGLYLAARHQGLAPDLAAKYSQQDFDALDEVKKAELRAVVAAEMKQNRYDPATGTLVLTDRQAGAFRPLEKYYTDLFRAGNDRMGLQPGIVRTDKEGHVITSFFAWLAWAAGTNRPGQEVTYTSNWPFDPLVGNGPLPGALLWSIASVVLLILGIGVILFVYMRWINEDSYRAKLVTTLAEPRPTPSQRATLAFFAVAMVLFVAQAILGPGIAHFTVEGNRFLGLPLAKYFPYAVLRTWHVQFAIFWIATCFVAAGLFLGPYVGREPRFQWQLALALLGAVAVVIGGMFVGTWLSVQGYMGNGWFLLGHQGYEYIELGRVWQALLAAGMVIWLVLVVRAIAPALRGEGDKGGLFHMLLYSAVSIPLFYLPAFLYGKGSHVSDAEYWRWWVVHLWVEGFFEVFATVMLAFFLSRIGAISEKFGLVTVYLAVFLYLGSGVIGTFHHLYWSGTPVPIMALGGVFSALEIVPLALLGFEAAVNARAVARGGKRYPFKWPLMFFLAVAFWNMLGAGVFGFLINPPIVLYYIQGTNTTALHAHTALYGVYGTLAIALMLFSMRNIVPQAAWSDRLLKWSFWCLNGGLLAMTLVSLLPAGFYQFYYAVKYGMWYARSPEIASGPVIRALSYARIGPDLVFWAGSLLMLAFVLRATFMTLNPASGKKRPG
jgi:nitric oxide reductase subunit B